MYGHPEGWAKRAQAAHARADRLACELMGIKATMESLRLTYEDFMALRSAAVRVPRTPALEVADGKLREALASLMARRLAANPRTANSASREPSGDFPTGSDPVQEGDSGGVS